MPTQRIHELKLWPTYFEAVACGDKSCEIRFNDRDFKLGDKIVFHEWEPRHKVYLGRSTTVVIAHILYATPVNGLGDGFVALSIRWPGETREGSVHDT